METVIDRFFATARQCPNTLAVIADSKTVTYKELALRLGQIADAIDQWFQREAGRSVGPNDIIGISLDKSSDLPAAMMAIMALGAAYVPIDPELDQDAQAYILNCCKCKLVVCESTALRDIDGIGRLNPEEIPQDGKPITVGSRACPNDRCYVIFTSGSTGRPKGVPILHRNLLNLCDWVATEFKLGSANHVLQFSTINFDASVLDIFPTLATGATLCLPTREQRLSESELALFCAQHRIDHAFLPPALLAVLDSERFPCLRTVLSGGESCGPTTLATWTLGRRFYNLYGPTECTVLVSFKSMHTDTLQTNIGRAIPGVRLHILDAHMRPAQRGELYIAGMAVSPGYLHDAAKSAANFVNCPAVSSDQLYKTGDIVEIDASGDLHFIGRTDRQVKVRGFRVESEEIEAAIMNAGCTQAALKVSPQGALIAYFAAHNMSSTDLRNRLAQSLSDFKIPQYFVALERLPQKPSGKVDFDALPSPIGVPAWRDVPADATSAELAPIFALWAKELNVHPDTLHGDSDFRELGGTSLNILRLLGNIENQYCVRISFINFLKNPTPNFIHGNLKKHEHPISA